MEEQQNPALEAGDDVVEEQAAEEQPTEEPAEDAAEPTEDAAEPDSEDVSKSKQRREKRKAYIASLEAERDEAQAKYQRIKSASESDDAPKETDFEDYEDFRIARLLHEQAKKQATRQVSEAEREAQEREARWQRERQSAFVDATEAARVKYKDFDQVAMNPRLPINQSMAEAIQEMDAGPDVLYHLGSNPEVALRIAKMRPMQQAIELGRLEASLAAPKPRTETRAPEPITPLRARASGQRDPAKMSNAEYRAWRMKQGT